MTHITLETSPAPDDVSLVLDGLRAFNASRLGEAGRASYALFLRDESDAIVGGLTAEVRWQWLHVDLLWVAESHRGQGHGSALLVAAEAEARRLGCVGAHLETGDFQARPFYERHGYTVFGTLEGFPVGSRMYFLRKNL